MKTQHTYISPSQVTRIRVIIECDECWAIDGADDDGNYTERCWNRDGHPDEPLTRERAIELADDFAAEDGLPTGLPVYAQSIDHDGAWILVRPARPLHD